MANSSPCGNPTHTKPTALWGPRGIAVDREGTVYVTDTGNNRVVIFDENGNYQQQFGRSGINPGEFDEPVGIAVDGDERVYVADTWNQRIQVFEPAGKEGYSVLRFLGCAWLVWAVHQQ